MLMIDMYVYRYTEPRNRFKKGSGDQLLWAGDRHADVKGRRR
jgi:hypothetical protein